MGYSRIVLAALLFMSSCTSTAPAATSSTATPVVGRTVSPSAYAACPHDWTVQSPVLQLSEPGVQTLTVQVCTEISGSGELGGSVVSSDTSVLAVVPYPFPAGVWAYFALHTGTAVLSFVPSRPSCPPNAMCPSTVSWSVVVTVTA